MLLFLLEACRIAYVLYVFLLEMFQQRIRWQDFVWFVCFKSYFNSKRVCTRNFMCKLMCMMRVSFKVTHRMGLWEGCMYPLRFFLLVTSCNAACNVGRYCHAFLSREKRGAYAAWKCLLLMCADFFFYQKNLRRNIWCQEYGRGLSRKYIWMCWIKHVLNYSVFFKVQK